MYYRAVVVIIACITVACANEDDLIVVTPEQYATDAACWGGVEGRYRGVAVFSGEDNRRMFLLSNSCSIEEPENKYSAFRHIGIMRVSDNKGKLRKQLKDNIKIWDSFITPVPMPQLDQNLYIIDFDAIIINSNGFKYIEIENVHRLYRTEIRYQDLLNDYQTTMRNMKEKELRK